VERRSRAARGERNGKRKAETEKNIEPEREKERSRRGEKGKGLKGRRGRNKACGERREIAHAVVATSYTDATSY